MTQLDRIERMLTALCRVAGGDPAKQAAREAAAARTETERKLAAVRDYARTLSASQVPSSVSHAKTLLKLIGEAP